MEYGLIGEKLGHSFSKIVHNELSDYTYELKEIPKEEFASFMEKADFKAINVTIPYKQDVIPYLYEIDKKAEEIGAVNTVVNKNGKLYGYNTDCLGLEALIAFEKIDIKDKKVLILGSGGTSKTAFVVAKNLGAREIYCVSRTAKDGLIDYHTAQSLHNDADIIINTTPCGMYPNVQTKALSIDNFKKLSALIDAVYNPLNSRLVLDAKNKGIKAIGGLYMLVAQAVFASEKFTDSKISSCEIERIYKKLLGEKENIILIGMPTSGKTTIGKALATKISKTFVDSDEEIVKKEGKSIPQIFSLVGEKGFRIIETQVISQIALKQGVVVATGGGVVLNKENIDLLKANGKVIFLDRPLDKLITTDDRPLSSSRDALEKRYNERYDLYCKSADIVIKADGSIEENLNKVLEAIG